MSDVLIIGAGVVGCASALALAKSGLSVCVFERAPSDGASWAAAGIIGPQIEAAAEGPMARLCLASRAMYPEFAAALVAATGIDVGLRRSGVLRVALSADERESIAREVAWQREAGFSVEELDGDEARALEPSLGAEIHGAVRFAEDGRVDPPSLMRALRIAASLAGARFLTGVAVRRVLVERDRACGVLLEDGTKVEGAWTVLAAGSWSTLIEGTGLALGAVRPARGQIVELTPSMPVIKHVVFGSDGYLSPRDDGRVLVGSTTEFVGYVPGVTARAVRDLLASAIQLVPALGDAPVGRTWSGLRPHTRDELPLLGEGEIGKLILATGHFRNGVLLAPLTGELVAALITGRQPAVDLSPFSAKRPAIAAA